MWYAHMYSVHLETPNKIHRLTENCSIYHAKMERGKYNYKPAKTAELIGLVKKALEAVLPMLVVLQRAKAQVTGFID